MFKVLSLLRDSITPTMRLSVNVDQRMLTLHPAHPMQTQDLIILSRVERILSKKEFIVIRSSGTVELGEETIRSRAWRTWGEKADMIGNPFVR